MKKQFVLLASLMIACGAPMALTSNQNLSGFTAIAQSNSKVTGTVTELNGVEGKFSIKAAQGSTLVVTYIGSKPTEVQVTGSVVNVKVADGTTNLDEVVVTALGIKKDKNRSAMLLTT